MTLGTTISSSDVHSFGPEPFDFGADFFDRFGPHAEVPRAKPVGKVSALVDQFTQRGGLKVQRARGSLELFEEGVRFGCDAHEVQSSVKNRTTQADISHSAESNALRYSEAMDVNEILRIRLKFEMEQQGYNPNSLSKRAGLNRRAVTDILDGKSSSPRVETVYALGKVLGFTLDEMIGLRPAVTIAPQLAELLGQYSQDEQAQLAAAIAALPRRPPTQ